jgi:hypothetical protein
MKKLKEIKNLHGIFIDSITELDGKLQAQFKKIKNEYQQNLINEKYKLLVDICNGEGLDFEKIQSKYLKSKEISLVSEEEKVKGKIEVDEHLLDKIEINGTQYYYEPKEKGIVYDATSKEVGLYKSGKIVFN